MPRGGASLGCDWLLAAGTPVEIDRPGAGGSVPGRAVRSGDGSLTVVFGSDPAAMAQIDRVLDSLVPKRIAT